MSHRSMRVAPLALALAACGSPVAHRVEAVDAGVPDEDAGFIPAGHPPLPAVPNHGGPLLDQVSIVTVTWPHDPLARDLVAFDRALPTSRYWTTSLAEYGIDAGGQVASWTAPELAAGSLSDASLRALLWGAIDAGLVPPPSPERLYDVYPPPGVQIAEELDGGVYLGCVDFTGYHAAAHSDAGELFYAVVPRCAQPGLSDLEAMTWPASHEIAEASSDPEAIFGPAPPGWILLTSDPIAPFGGEVADLCQGNSAVAGSSATDGGYLVAALYSNRAAAAGERPCVPSDPGPMFGAYANPNRLTLSAGSSARATLSVFSTAPLSAPLTLDLLVSDPALSAVAGSARVQNNDQVPLELTLLDSAASGATYLVQILTSFGAYQSSTYVVVSVP